MNIDKYLNELDSLYSYDIRTKNALKKIIPCMIRYYGNEYENIISSAIRDCEIIHCDSFQTISKVLNSNNLSDAVYEIRNNDGVYVSKPNIVYDDVNNEFIVRDVIRKIVISHTYNFDSPKGLEVLTLQLCSLVKSYYKEYFIQDNILQKNNGIAITRQKINYNTGNITLDFLDSSNNSLEEGMNYYDTEKIVSDVLNDTYKCYGFDSIYSIAMILKEKYKLKSIINRAEILKDMFTLKRIYNVDPDDFDKLSVLADNCYELEEKMIVYSMTREEKNKIREELTNLLSKDVYNCLVKYISLDNKKEFKTSEI